MAERPEPGSRCAQPFSVELAPQEQQRPKNPPPLGQHLDRRLHDLALCARVLRACVRVLSKTYTLPVICFEHTKYRMCGCACVCVRWELLQLRNNRKPSQARSRSRAHAICFARVKNQHKKNAIVRARVALGEMKCQTGKLVRALSVWRTIAVLFAAALGGYVIHAGARWQTLARHFMCAPPPPSIPAAEKRVLRVPRKTAAV